MILDLTRHLRAKLLLGFVPLWLAACSTQQVGPGADMLTVSRADYQNKLYGFWLGQNIGNWTGLVTELDKLGDLGDHPTGPFYTRENWGGPDHPAFWGDAPSTLSPTIDFVVEEPGGVWGADDDTDIEYIYQHLLLTHQTSMLTAEQIRDGWLKHIRAEEENYLWVSNQQAFDLMRDGLLPPQTGQAAHNPHYDMIDAQLTTEIFGLFAPGRPDIALTMANLPVRTSASREATWIAEFYIIMHALAAISDEALPRDQQLQQMAAQARQHLPEESYPADMYDFVKGQFDSGVPWEAARDAVYQRYQVDQAAGYDITSRNLTCNGCFAAGINFAASLVSLFYGAGDLKETIKIGTLAGWDSDNPTATWAGLIGFMIGRSGVEEAFGQRFAEHYNIHRTRQNFPGDGIVSFDKMARDGVTIVDRAVTEEMGGEIGPDGRVWLIPTTSEEVQK